jgi:DNA-binding GntR family transcriptional regulator
MSDQPQPVPRILTKSEQIVQYYASLICTGHLKPSEKMPTAKEIKRIWDVGQDTAEEAITQLRRDGFVETRGRNGTFVL